MTFQHAGPSVKAARRNMLLTSIRAALRAARKHMTRTDRLSLVWMRDELGRAQLCLRKDEFDEVANIMATAARRLSGIHQPGESTRLAEVEVRNVLDDLQLLGVKVPSRVELLTA